MALLVQIKGKKFRSIHIRFQVLQCAFLQMLQLHLQYLSNFLLIVLLDGDPPDSSINKGD